MQSEKPSKYNQLHGYSVESFVYMYVYNAVSVVHAASSVLGVYNKRRENEIT